MFFTYILQSINNPDQIYIGYSSDVKKRLASHNRGESKHTSKFKPWKLMACVCFSKREKAIAFEKYLKSHSGRGFLKKRFV